MTSTKSVLIVEDERIVAKDIQLTLRSLGYDAYALAASADEAVARAEERRPDLVLMDIRIRGAKDGIEAAQTMRDRFDVPVVFLTAHADDATLDRASRTQPYGYLLKPVKAAELRSAVEIALYKHVAEKRERARERWYATTLHAIADAVVSVDGAGRVTFVNAAAEGLTGIRAADAIGFPLEEVLQLRDRRGSAIDVTSLSTISTQEEVGLVNVVTGEMREVRASVANVVDESKLGTVMVFRDITDERKVQRQLELADRLTALGTMIEGLVSEVNNPLAIVLSNAAYVDEEMTAHRSDLRRARVDFDATAHERVENLGRLLADVRVASRRIEKIVTDLRTFARPPSVRPAGEANLARAISWAVQSTQALFRDRAEVTVAIPETAIVSADDARIGHVFLNLLTNAAQAIHPGQYVDNRVTVVATEKDDAIVVDVTDSGVGIPAAVRQRVFEPFFTTRAVGAGTGLGLSICRGIVTSLGGTIEVFSPPPSPSARGTTVRVTLPKATGAAT